MNKSKNHISVFEHQSIRLDQVIDKVCFDAEKLKALQIYYGEKGVPYYSLIHNGVRFNEYVGVIQVGSLIINVLPKADKIPSETQEKEKWKNILIEMLLAVGNFEVNNTSYSQLKIRPNSILDLYFELFINELEHLIHKGLVKLYRKKESNLFALKGKLEFDRHIQKNLTNQERFYVKHTSFDVEHNFHFILYKTLCLLKQINTNLSLQSRIGALLLDFPEMPSIKVNCQTFEKLIYNRRTLTYKKAIDLAKLILLNYHPDISKGRNNVLALMFDMNLLWEQFVLVSLRKNKDLRIKAQYSKSFWSPESGNTCKIRPDMVIIDEANNYFVLDTKWKNIEDKNPSLDDLRQMYVYLKYYQAEKAALVYPNHCYSLKYGKYFHEFSNHKGESECSLISIEVNPHIKLWQKEIQEKVVDWFNVKKI